ncbi:MAG: ABC transporter ATP-binding protein [Clostridia bacterium]|nr:ABC transporter ATP-binding protein [Clostridia bacterium]
MLKLVNIVKEYKVAKQQKTLALKGVSIEFRKNEFVSILGPSGCGKTTLLNIIGGLDRYSDGDIQIDGVSTKEYDDVDWDTYRNRKIGFVFQSYNLIPHMNILKNVAMSLTIGGVDRDERKARALEALKKVGLAAQARKKPNQLSGGQMQRVAIARALVNNPDIILADEPTGALDSESGLQVMDLLKEVAEDRLVIMVTHNPMLAEEYSTRIVYLKDGEVEGDTMPFSSDESQITAEDSGLENNESHDDNDSHDDIGGGDVTFEEPQFVFVNEGEKAVALDSLEIPQEVKPKKGLSIIDKLKKIRHADKTAMKLSTAISLSWANLLSKKGRTFLTSVAGSIGIIGIILVLALSNGAGIYVNSLEESALSSYPIKVNKTTTDIDIGTIMSALMSSSGDGKFDENIITTQEVLGNVIANIMPNHFGK